MSSKNKILFVVTSHDEIKPGRPSGLWLEEFATPYEQFVAQGYDVTVASPKGGTAPVDPGSDEARPEWLAAREVLKNTAVLSSITAEAFNAIFIPGGHGTMYDLPNNPKLAVLLSEFAAAGKVIASVCHGPAAFVGAKRSNGDYLVAGKTLTSFLDDEERAAQLDKDMPFLLESALRAQGANFQTAPLWSDHVERDGNLITGQNPASAASAARAVIAALNEKVAV